MTSSKPVIGLSLGLHDFGDYAGVGFQRPVALAGGVPLMLPRVEGAFLDEALAACDGILIGGGRDIEPGLYGQEPGEHLAPTEPLRDAFELELVERTLDSGLPLLGMCRGIQILNAALGAEEADVDSFHHQALDGVASELTVVARAPDGVVEAVELDGDGYVLAVQWELQEEWRVDRRFLGPFAQLVEAASGRRERS